MVKNLVPHWNLLHHLASRSEDPTAKILPDTTFLMHKEAIGGHGSAQVSRALSLEGVAILMNIQKLGYLCEKKLCHFEFQVKLK